MKDWHELSVAVVGNFNPPESGIRYQAEVLADHFEAEGANVLRVTFQQNRYLRPLWTAFELFRPQRRYDIACVQAFSYWNFVNAAIAVAVVRGRGKRAVVVYRGGAGPRFLERFPRAVPAILRRAHRLIVPSQFLAGSFSRHGLRCTVIPNLIDLEEFPYRERREFAPHLVWVRHLREGYKPWMAIEVLRGVQERYPGATLTLIGEGPLRSELEARARAEGIRGVHFMGELPQREVRAWLDRSSIFLNTASTDNQPRSVLEAMAAGLPVVSTDAGGVPFLVSDGDSGLLVPVGDVAEMVRAVLRILDAPELGRQLASAGHRRVKEHTWEGLRSRWLAALSGPEPPAETPS